MDKDNYTILSEAYLQIRAAYDICCNDSTSIVRLINQKEERDARIKFDLLYTAISSANHMLEKLVEADKSSWEA